MRKVLGVTLAGLLMFAGASAMRADDQADARAIIDKAMKALGGQEQLADVKAVTWKEKGTYYGRGKGEPYTGTFAVEKPDKFRMVIEGVFTLVLNGDTAWTKMNDETKEMTNEQLAEQKEQHYASLVRTLTPLSGKAFKLAPLGEIKVAKSPAVGVKVSHKGHRDVNLYFDKETGLLVKSEFRVKASEQGGKEVEQETFYSDYKAFDGVKFPQKIVVKRDGKQFVEAEASEFKPAAKLDKSLFDKP